MVLPSIEPPQAAAIFSAMRRLRASLTSTVAPTIRSGVPAASAVRSSASVSFGTHLPP